MAKCYYCTNGCNMCCKITTSSYGAEAIAKVPSPNEVKPPVVAKQTVAAQQIARAEKFVKELCEKANAQPKVKYYGWVSKQSNQHNHTSIYRCPDGSEVEVSFVNDSSDDHGSGWTDCQCIGEVTEWLRKA